MDPTKTNGRKLKGLSTPVSLTKRTQRVGSKKLVSATIAHGNHPTIVEAGTDSLQDVVILNMVLLRMISARRSR